MAGASDGVRDSGAASCCHRRRRSQVESSMRLKIPTVRARAGTTPTPVTRKMTDSTSGQTGRAAAGLKSPGTYQWPRWKWRMAASPYQPSSVYLDQSIQGEWLGKSAWRWRVWKPRKMAATRRRRTWMVLKRCGEMEERWPIQIVRVIRKVEAGVQRHVAKRS